jgi:hypothetical protein
MQTDGFCQHFAANTSCNTYDLLQIFSDIKPVSPAFRSHFDVDT